MSECKGKGERKGEGGRGEKKGREGGSVCVCEEGSVCACGEWVGEC